MFNVEGLRGGLGGMFEEMAVSAVRMLVFFFWATLGFSILWSALWLRDEVKRLF